MFFETRIRCWYKNDAVKGLSTDCKEELGNLQYFYSNQNFRQHYICIRFQMNQLTAFYELKQLVLLRYREEYPYVSSEWKTFSSKDILQLIDSIETATKQRISEKWIYTHLKPSENEKMPRKDMLDILSNYCRFDSWDAFLFSVNTPISVVDSSEKKEIEKQKPTVKKILFLLTIGVLIVITLFSFVVFVLKKSSKSEQKVLKEEINVPIKDFYTQEEIEDTTIQLFVKENGNLKQLEVNNISAEVLKKTSELVVESPFYSEAKVEVTNGTKAIVLKADDYAMMLKAFMQSDIKDWETRKIQLDKILSDNLEVLIHLQNSLGIEYMNKTEFAQKLTIPTKAIKNWQILSLEQNEWQQITKIRIKQN